MTIVQLTISIALSLMVLAGIAMMSWKGMT